MGYQTKFSLELQNLQDIEFATIMADLFAHVQDAMYALENDGSAYDAVSWYDHVQDMQLFSRRWSHVIFALKGKGEENGDLWHKYFQNGKVQICNAIITFDSFDPEKLA